MSVVGLGLFSFSCVVGDWLRVIKKPTIHCSSKTHDSKDHIHLKILEDIIAECPTLHKPYFPSLFFHNGHLQLIPYTLKGYFTQLVWSPYTWKTEEVILRDGETINLDWIDIPSYSANDDSPILIMHPGCFGDSGDIPHCYISEALQRGWKVCVWNRRGHLRKLKSPQWNFFGGTDDLRYIMQHHLHGKRPRARLLMLGLSAGSGLIARYMGEQGLLLDGKRETMNDDEYNTYLNQIGYCSAAVGMSPGYDIEKCFSRFSPPIANMLLNKGKRFYIQENAELLKDCPGYKECLEAKDLQTWIYHSYGMGGFDSPEEYYEKTDPMRVVCHIKQPTLMLNAADDPVCVIANVHDQMHLFETEMPLGAVVVVTETGSHCPFYEVGLFSWAGRVSFEFFDAAL